MFPPASITDDVQLVREPPQIPGVQQEHRRRRQEPERDGQLAGQLQRHTAPPSSRWRAVDVETPP